MAGLHSANTLKCKSHYIPQTTKGPGDSGLVGGAFVRDADIGGGKEVNKRRGEGRREGKITG